MLRRIFRWKSFLVVSGLLLVCLFYTFIDVKSMKYIRSSRKLQIAHLTAEDIRKSFNEENGPYDEESLIGAASPNSNDWSSNQINQINKNDELKDVHPHQSHQLSSTTEKREPQVQSRLPTSPSSQSLTSLQKKQKIAIDKLVAIANNETILTKEKELVSLSKFNSIPVDKRKRLETYLSRLSQSQFNEVFRTVMGYENEAAHHFVSKALIKHQDVERSTRASLMKRVIETAENRKPCINGCKAHKLLAGNKGYASRVVVESVTLPVDWTTPDEVIQRLEHRKNHVKDVCHKNGLDIASPTNSLNAWEFLINSQHKLVWCSIFKAASSTWFYNFNMLAGYSEDRLLKSKETPVSLARKKYPRPTKEVLDAALNSTDPPLSFLIVRHPLTRLVSGYRDKLLPGRRYYRSLSEKIVKAYPHLGKPGGPELRYPIDAPVRSKTRSKGLAGARRIVVPTFPQFVQHVIDSLKRGEPVDEHWMPMYKFCTPCLFQFDVIAKTETLDEDGNYIIFQSGIQNIVKPKHINRNRNAPTNSVVDSFLCQLSRSMMEELIEVYKYDLELFEYDYEKYLNCTTDSVRLEQVKQN